MLFIAAIDANCDASHSLMHVCFSDMFNFMSILNSTFRTMLLRLVEIL